MPILFRRTQKLEGKIDAYLDLVITGGLLFRQGVEHYLAGRREDLERCIQGLNKAESEADHLRRDVETSLYAQTLIPESRGDVLGLLESSDRVLNRTEETLSEFAVERPYFPPEVHSHLASLASSACSSIESMACAVRAYFYDPVRCRDHVAKVAFYEHEADATALIIMRTTFDSDLQLAQKAHIRFFVHQIESISDRAEDVCDRLAIAVIKRYD